MGQQGFPGGGAGGFYSQGFDMNDFFSRHGDLNDFLNSMFGGGFGGATGGRRSPRKRRGGDVRIRVKLTLDDIAKGVTKTLRVPTFRSASIATAQALRTALPKQLAPYATARAE